MLVIIVSIFLLVNLPQAFFMAMLCVCNTFGISIPLLEGLFPAVFLLVSNMLVMVRVQTSNSNKTRLNEISKLIKSIFVLPSGDVSNQLWNLLFYVEQLQGHFSDDFLQVFFQQY